MRRTTAAWCMPACTISSTEHGTRWPADAAEQLRRAMARALAEADLREALAAWWAPRLERIADWVAQIEAERRSERPPVALADRGERDAGTGAARRAVPADRPRRPDRAAARRRARDPGLQDRHAARARRRSMPAWRRNCCWRRRWRRPGRSARQSAGAAEELTYWHLTGGFHPGELRALFKGDAAAIAAAVARGARGAVRADRRV